MVKLAKIRVNRNQGLSSLSGAKRGGAFGTGPAALQFIVSRMVKSDARSQVTAKRATAVYGFLGVELSLDWTHELVAAATGLGWEVVCAMGIGSLPCPIAICIRHPCELGLVVLDFG